VLWSHSKEKAKELEKTRENKIKLPDIKINKDIIITSDLEYSIKGSEIIILSVPSALVKETSINISKYVNKEQLIINTAKGFDLDTLNTLSTVIREVLPDNEIAVLSGPSHAEEVARNIPTSILIASFNKKIIRLVQDNFMNDNFRIYGSKDITGVEIGGAVKNVIALASGIADGLGFGDNTKAALMTRGFAEIKRLGVKMGAKPSTLYGLSGIGDLIVTCTSMNSRNRRAGILIGQGYKLKEAEDKIKMVIEGVNAAKACHSLMQKFDISMPITESVYNILFKDSDPKKEVISLMTRQKKLYE
jgi:glycerol-3-phosphate dehydrogenase (NAD(P)+)